MYGDSKDAVLHRIQSLIAKRMELTAQLCTLKKYLNDAEENLADAVLRVKKRKEDIEEVNTKLAEINEGLETEMGWKKPAAAAVAAEVTGRKFKDGV